MDVITVLGVVLVVVALGVVIWVMIRTSVNAADFATGRVIELLQNIDDELYRKRLGE